MDVPVSVAPVTGVIGFEHDLKRGTLAVTQQGNRIGVIVDTGSDWLNGDKPTRVEYRVLDAGPAVPVPTGPFTSTEAAACAIVGARRAYRAWLTPGADGLTEFDRRALEFEMTPEAQTGDGTREREITARFNGIHPTVYAQQVTRLLRERRAAARAHNPAAVTALERRTARNRARRRPIDRPGDRRLSA